MGIQQRLYAQAHCNPSRQKSLDNRYTNMISSVMLPRQTTLPPAPPSGQLLSSHRLAASCILLALFLPAPSFFFNHLQTFLQKSPGVGGTPTLPSQDSLPRHMRHVAPLSPVASVDCAYFLSPQGCTPRGGLIVN